MVERILQPLPTPDAPRRARLHPSDQVGTLLDGRDRLRLLEVLSADRGMRAGPPLTVPFEMQTPAPAGTS